MVVFRCSSESTVQLKADYTMNRLTGQTTSTHFLQYERCYDSPYSKYVKLNKIYYSIQKNYKI